MNEIDSDPSTSTRGGNGLEPSSRSLVSLIIVNHNGMEVLPRCLAAIADLSYPRCEIILVDNGSKDGSAEFAESFPSKYPFHLLRFPENRGLAIARNAGARIAKGQYLAFLDNDGFPEPDWLNAALETFDGNPRIGAVASLVLFDKRPEIINGLGGGMTHRGFGFDHLYHRTMGFHPFPEDVLYPMGCGMIIRKEVADLVFPIDDLLINYYDDVEIGIRTWNFGYRVESCVKARVKHAFGHSSPKASFVRKEILCQRNRLRTALKYWPLLSLPGFIFSEFKELQSFMRERAGSFSDIFIWNFRHLRSAMSIRRRFPAVSSFNLPAMLVRMEQYDYPTNTDFSPDWNAMPPVIDMEQFGCDGSLDFGWYHPEKIEQVTLRCTADLASAFLRTSRPTDQFLFRFMPFTEDPVIVELMDMATGQIPYRWEFSGEIAKVLAVSRPVLLPPGDYRVMLKCDFARRSNNGRLLGVGVNFIGLWSDS